VRFARRAGVYSTTTPSAATGAAWAPRDVRPVLAQRVLQHEPSLRSGRARGSAPDRLVSPDVVVVE